MTQPIVGKIEQLTENNYPGILDTMKKATDRHFKTWPKRMERLKNGDFMDDQIEISIPDLPISRNQIDNAHWTARGKYKKELELLVKIATRGIKPVKGQVKIHIHFTFADKRKHDFDNYIHKALFDAIVRSGIIEDDNIDVVRELRTTAERGDKKQTQITITKIGGTE